MEIFEISRWITEPPVSGDLFVQFKVVKSMHSESISLNRRTIYLFRHNRQPTRK